MSRNTRDLLVGAATIPASPCGGWALPGGRITHCPDEVMSAATEIDRVLVSLRQARKASASTRRVVTRRQVASFHPVYNLV